ncbi:MAG: hypothetical protein ABMA26_25635 [Limisphaerales bacterium]
MVEYATDPKLLHGPVALLQVETDEMPALAVRNDSAPHQARDVAHTTLEVQCDLALGFPVFAGSWVGLCCCVHNEKFGVDSLLGMNLPGV